MVNHTHSSTYKKMPSDFDRMLVYTRVPYLQKADFNDPLRMYFKECMPQNVSHDVSIRMYCISP